MTKTKTDRSSTPVDQEIDPPVIAPGQQFDMRGSLDQLVRELLAHFPAQDVTSWLGNSPEIANKRYAMTMQASFDRAVQDGAKIAGVTADVVDSKTPPSPPPTVQDNLPLNQDTKKGRLQ